MDLYGKILALLQSKGGTGKSTAGMNVAVAATERGLTVAIVDTDPKAARHDQWPKVFAMRPRDLAGWLRSEGKDFDLIVIDTAGHDTDTLADVARIADLSVIVTQPTRLAIAVATLLQRAFVNAAGPYAILLSQTPPRLTSRLAKKVFSEHLLNRLGVQSASEKPVPTYRRVADNIMAESRSFRWHLSSSVSRFTVVKARIRKTQPSARARCSPFATK